MICLEPFFACVDVFGEILHDGYDPKWLVWSYAAVAKIRVRIVRKRRDAHAKLKSPSAKFFLHALRIVVKLAHAKAHDMAMKRAILAVKYTNARQIIIAAQTRM